MENCSGLIVPFSFLVGWLLLEALYDQIEKKREDEEDDDLVKN